MCIRDSHCIHFPEAVPLVTHEAVDVAKALVSVFNHFGFARKILSDCGREFMSQLTKVFWRSLALSTFVLVHIILLLMILRTFQKHFEVDVACGC